MKNHKYNVTLAKRTFGMATEHSLYQSDSYSKAEAGFKQYADMGLAVCFWCCNESNQDNPTPIIAWSIEYIRLYSNSNTNRRY